MAKLKKYILSDNIDRAISLCNSRPQALLPKILKAGLTRAKDTPGDIQNAIDEATLEALPKRIPAAGAPCRHPHKPSSVTGIMAVAAGLPRRPKPGSGFGSCDGLVRSRVYCRRSP